MKKFFAILLAGVLTVWQLAVALMTQQQTMTATKRKSH